MPRYKGSSPLAHLAAWRLWAGLNQEQLAKKVGVSPQGVKFWEEGLRHPKMEIIARLADALGIPVEVLINCDPRDGWGERVLRERVAQQVMVSFRGLLADLRELAGEGERVIAR